MTLAVLEDRLRRLSSLSPMLSYTHIFIIKISCTSRRKSDCYRPNKIHSIESIMLPIVCRCPHLQGDAIAGLTVGLTVIPQGLAYAQIAELSPEV